MHTSGGPRPDAPGTLTAIFFAAAERHDKPNALQYKADGRWIPLSHAEIVRRVRHLALALADLGLVRGDRVAILSENRPEWCLADWACLTAGMADVPVYPTLPAEQIPHLLNDSGARVAFASTPEQVAKLAQVRGQCPSLQTVVTFAAERVPGADLTLAECEARGAALDSPDAAAAWKAAALGVRPGDLATLIYTSGTTGLPKGVMLSHDNIASNVAACREKVPFPGDDVMLSFLPLSHIFERMVDYLAWDRGASIAYAESIDTVPQNLVEVRPTLVCSVPRLYEKMYARILETALRGGALKRTIFFWARDVAYRWADVRLAGGTPAGLLAFQYRLAQRLVFAKLQARTGGRLRYFVSGGAPLAPAINKFFFAAGITILEGYGLTETSPVISVNTPALDGFRIGTVGKVVAGVEVRIAEDGEILCRGPNVMLGYYNSPDATRDAIDAEGWFHTGDIGVLEDGFLRITDRKKDLIVTAGGKNIAPQPIENRVKTNKFVSQAVMIGDKRPYPVLLIVPNFESLEQWARHKGIAFRDAADLVALPPVRAKMEAEVRGTFVGLASFETPKKIALLPRDFSIERGELTPKLSVKRRVVDEHYRDVIDALYAEASTAA